MGASDLGSAGTRVQVNEGRRAVIAYYNHQTRKHEKNYYSYELEMLAIKESIKTRSFLLSSVSVR